MCARSSERGACRFIGIHHSSNHAFQKWTVELNNLVTERCFTQRNKCLCCGRCVAFDQGTKKPGISNTWHRTRIGSPYGLYQSMQRFNIPLPHELQVCEFYLRMNVIRNDSQCTDPSSFFLRVTAQCSQAQGNLL